MLPTYAEDDVEAFEGDQVGDRYSCLLGLNPCLLLILLIMLLKDVDVDIYRSSCCPCCRTLFRRSLVTASETAIRIAVTPLLWRNVAVVLFRIRLISFVNDYLLKNT